MIYSDEMLQDIIGNYEIKLDFFFKVSLTNDIVNVSIATAICRLRFHIGYNGRKLKYYRVWLQMTQH